MDDLVLFYPEGHEAHYEHGHPERPERVEAIRSALQKAGWWDRFPRVQPLSLPEEALHAIHSPAYLANLQAASRQGRHLDMDTYTTPASWDLALKAAGGAASVAAAVWERRAKRGFALTRPPGHHAAIDRGMGFCLLNNVALAAEYLVREFEAQRLAIVDLDLHHGNGTQDIFWRRPDVFYFSIHQSPLYPGTGMVSERGADGGFETNVNIPLPPMSGDEAFREAMSKVISPLLDRFSPQMLLVSIGFDTHWRDPLGNLLLSAGVYAESIANLANWADQNCDGRIALFLEGGYDLQAGAACSTAAVSALLGEAWEDPLGPPPYKEGEAWQKIIKQICQIWGVECDSR